MFFSPILLSPVHVRKLTAVPPEGRMKERKRREEEDDMNRHLGERAGEATFLTLPVFCWIRERINLAGFFHVSGPYR